jgi:hypothetical protein
VNFAFAAVVLFFLFAPGVFFRRACLSYPLSRRYAASSASDEIAYAAVPAVVIQFLMVEAIQHWSSYRVDFASLGALLVGARGEEGQAEAFRQLVRCSTCSDRELKLGTMVLRRGIGILREETCACSKIGHSLSSVQIQ